MIVDNLGQTYDFLIAMLLGAALGVVYDLFKILRLVGIRSSFAVFVEDITFFAICTVAMFSYYMQFTDGKFRIFAFVAAVLGFVVYFKTLEKVVFFIVRKVYGFFVKIFGFLYKKIVYPPLKFLKKLLVKLVSKGKIFVKRIILEKILKNFKKLLPKKPKVLYNKKKSRRKKRGSRSDEQKEQTEKRAFFC